jgi:hypothetical protein
VHFVQGAIGAEILQNDDEGLEGEVTMNVLKAVRANKNVHFFHSFFKLCTSTDFWKGKESSYEGDTSRDKEDAFIKETFQSDVSAQALFTDDELIRLGR